MFVVTIDVSNKLLREFRFSSYLEYCILNYKDDVRLFGYYMYSSHACCDNNNLLITCPTTILARSKCLIIDAVYFNI